MIIIVSSTGKEATSMADLRFGRCKYFGIYNTETKKYNFIQNEAADASQGAGIAAAQVVVESKGEAVLTGNLGPKAFKVLTGSNIYGYTIGEVSVENAIAAFLENKLSKILEFGNSQK